MGDQAHSKLIFISESLSLTGKQNPISLIREYKYVFAWSYEDMSSLDPQVAMHHLNIKLDAKPVKEQQRQFQPDIMEAIEAEVYKLIEYGFIREEQHLNWVANVMPVPKKNKKIRVCIDFRDLRTTCLKDEFLLSITDIMIDNMCDFKRMSYVNGFSGYNQIKLHLNAEKHMSFRIPLGVYYYTVMPFRLKNEGATYQCAMSTFFLIIYGKW